MRSTPAGARARDHLTLAREGRRWPPSTRAHLPHALVVGHKGAVEEDLVEVHLAANVAQRSNLDARLAQVDAGNR